MQGDRPLRPGRRQYRPARRQGERHRRQLRAGLLHPRSLRPHHGAAAGTDPQGSALQQTGAERPLGNAGGGADPAHRGHRARPGRLRPHPAPGGAESAGLRHQGPCLRPLREAGRLQGGERRGRRSRHLADARRLRLDARAAAAGDARHAECGRLRQNEEGCLCREHRPRPADRRAGADRGARCGTGRRRRA